MKVNIYQPKYNRSKGAYEVKRANDYSYGDRVYIAPYHRYWGIPGEVVGKSQIQYLDRPGWYLIVRLCTGRDVSINQQDIALLPDGWPDFLPDPDDDGEDNLYPDPDEGGEDIYPSADEGGEDGLYSDPADDTDSSPDEGGGY